jgi:hypothetical protein
MLDENIDARVFLNYINLVVHIHDKSLVFTDIVIVSNILIFLYIPQRDVLLAFSSFEKSIIERTIQYIIKTE